MAHYQKMSKSRGNVIGVDEILFGVAELESGYEFRLGDGALIDYHQIPVWRDKCGTGYFYLGSSYGRLPVFLHEVGNSEPCILLLDGVEAVQHPSVARCGDCYGQLATFRPRTQTMTGP